jgi:hypothetical protein
VGSNLPPEGSFAVASALASAFDSDHATDSTSSRVACFLKTGETKTKPTATESLSSEPKPNPNPVKPVKPGKVRQAKDGTPWPENFDSLSQADRVVWLMEHDPDPKVKLELATYKASLKPEPEEEIDVEQYLIDEEDEVTRRLAYLKRKGIIVEDTRIKV